MKTFSGLSVYAVPFLICQKGRNTKAINCRASARASLYVRNSQNASRNTYDCGK